MNTERAACRWEQILGLRVREATWKGLTLRFDSVTAFIDSVDYCLTADIYRSSDGGRVWLDPEELVGRSVTGVVARCFWAGWFDDGPAWTELLLDDADWVIVASEDSCKPVELVPGFGLSWPSSSREADVEEIHPPSGLGSFSNQERTAFRWEQILGFRVREASLKRGKLVLEYDKITASIGSVDPDKCVVILRSSNAGWVMLDPEFLVGQFVTGVVARCFEKGRLHGGPAWTELLLNDTDWIAIATEDRCVPVGLVPDVGLPD